MNLILICYCLYIFISVAFTVWVGRNLHKNGRVFLLDAFEQDEVKADSVNQLLLVGFYLINFGFVCLFLVFGEAPTNYKEAFEYMAMKFGVVLIILGGMHFFNMRNLANFRGKTLKKIHAPVSAN